LGGRAWIIAYPFTENEEIKWGRQSENNILWVGIQCKVIII